MLKNKIIIISVVVAAISAWAICQHHTNAIKKDIENYHIAYESIRRKVTSLKKLLSENSTKPTSAQVKDLRGLWQIELELAKSLTPKTIALMEIHKHYVEGVKLEVEHYETFYRAIDLGIFRNVKKSDGGYKWEMRRYIVQGVGFVTDGIEESNAMKDLSRRSSDEFDLWNNRLKELSDEYGFQYVPKDDLAEVMGQAVCVKVKECIPLVVYLLKSGPNDEFCENLSVTSNVTKSQLDACVASFQKISCDQILNPSNNILPADCEFLE